MSNNMVFPKNLSDEQPISHCVDAGVGWLVLNNPPQKNVLSCETMHQMTARLAAFDGDKAVRVIVIAAIGDVFCAGHDLKELNAQRTNPDGGRAFFEKVMRQCVDMMAQIMSLSKPVIGVVDGLATAAGCQLIATCDLAICSAQSHFATPGVNIGLFCSTPMVALSRNVGRKQAMEMLLLGDNINADKAVELGLVNRAVADDQLATALADMTAILCAKSDITMTRGKQAFYEQIDLPIGAAYDHTINVMVENMMAADADEGIGAFIEKRKPNWQN